MNEVIWKILWIYIGIANVGAFMLYGIDKKKAERHAWRIPEHTLIMAAVIGGAFGAWAGMRVFHHKTQHHKFTILVPVFFLIWCSLLVFLSIKWM